jgi:myosin-15
MERIEIEEWPEFLKPVLPPAEKQEIEKVQEIVDTKLYPQTSSTHFTYNRVTWTLRVKKEVFAPNENLTTPLALHLVFCQVAYDVLATSNIRISKDDRQSMLKLLDNYGVTLDNLQSTQHKITIKKNVVDMAKQWPLYFARIFPVSVSNFNILCLPFPSTLKNNITRQSLTLLYFWPFISFFFVFNS